MRLFAVAEDVLVFKPKPKDKLDRKISKIMKLMKINDVPIVQLKKELYFIGIYKLNVTIKGDYLMVQIRSDKWVRFSEYIKDNREYFVKCLTLLSIKNNNMDLITLVNKLIKQDNLEGFNNSYFMNLSQFRGPQRDHSMDSLGRSSRQTLNNDNRFFQNDKFENSPEDRPSSQQTSPGLFEKSKRLSQSQSRLMARTSGFSSHMISK